MKNIIEDSEKNIDPENEQNQNRNVTGKEIHKSAEIHEKKVVKQIYKTHYIFLLLKILLNRLTIVPTAIIKR